MAFDTNKLINQLHEFYKFRNKTILTVGAGGGQLVEYARLAKKVLAVDVDRKALNSLQKRLMQMGFMDKYEFFCSDFLSLENKPVDLVFFEFSLHELPDPKRAIEHALALAPEVLIADHHPESEWAYFGNEEEKAEASWSATQNFTVAAQETYHTSQCFDCYDDLYKKVACQGERTIERISIFKDRAPITIDMQYYFLKLTR